MSAMSHLVSSFPRFAEHMEPHEIVFHMAKSGKIRQLKQYMSRRKHDERKLIVASKYNGATSLIMACRNGHYDVVEYLVEHCHAALEQTGLVNFEGENIEGAPPLWCASAAGHLRVVVYLVAKGANVNSTTKSNSTALRAACFDGHAEIVKYLVEHHADIEIANRHGHTCLMIACYKGHLDIARYLIARHADLNRKSVKGNTALHDCAECGSLDIMKLLLSHNARMAPDAYQMTPLLAAAVTGHAPIVEYLLTRPECAAAEKIAALELLGATYVDKKHDMLSAYTYWKSALERRRTASASHSHSHSHIAASEQQLTPEEALPAAAAADVAADVSAAAAAVAPTPPIPTVNTSSSLSKQATVRHNPIEAYDYATEFMNEEELDDIISDPDDVRMQALLIRERVLGPTHPDTTYYIRYRGAVYADCGNFRKCILLWLYALDTQQKSLDPLHPMIQSSFLSFTELFQYMQKQLAPFTTVSGGGGGGRDDVNIASTGFNNVSLNASNSAERNEAGGRGGGSGGGMSGAATFKNSNVYSMINMYTATVLKILQQAVEEIKRGMSVLKQHQKLPSTSESSSTTTTTTLAATTTAPSQNDEPSAATSARSSSSSTNSSQINFDMAHFDRTLVVIVHFLVVVAESLRHCSPEDTFKLKKVVFKLIKLNPTNSKQSTLLHLASSRDSSAVIKNHTLSSFPSTDVLRLLLECGADPNALDAERNTPLHLAAANRHTSLSATLAAAVTGPTISANSSNTNSSGTGGANANTAALAPIAVDAPVDVENAASVEAAAAAAAVASPAIGTMSSDRDKLVCLLLNAGTHLDTCNAQRKTAAELYKGGKLYQVINPVNYLTLQCLSAKVIQKFGIEYRQHMTPELANFVAMH